VHEIVILLGISLNWWSSGCTLSFEEATNDCRTSKNLFNYCFPEKFKSRINLCTYVSVFVYMFVWVYREVERWSEKKTREITNSLKVATSWDNLPNITYYKLRRFWYLTTIERPLSYCKHGHAKSIYQFLKKKVSSSTS